MSIYFGDDIKRVHFGEDIKHVYMGSEKIWSKIIRVTPQAPTFLGAAPWYTLPTQEGVSYSVAGAPGYYAMITVTATAKPGYELVGTTSWTHTFPPPARLAADGSGNTLAEVPLAQWVAVSNYTLPRDALASLSFNIYWQSTFGANYGLRITVNGAPVATLELTAVSGNGQSLSRNDAIYRQGDVVSFQAYSSNGNAFYRRVSSWNWSMS